MSASKKKKLFRVEFLETSRVGYVGAGSTIMDAAHKAGVYIVSVCGGKGVCGKCLVMIEKGRVRLKPNPFISGGVIKKGQVIACLSEVLSDVHVRMLEESRLDETPAFDEKHLTDPSLHKESIVPYPHNPLCRKVYLRLSAPSLNDALPDVERVESEFERTVGSPVQITGLDSIRTLPGMLRESDFNITVTYGLRNGALEVLNIEGGDCTESTVGLAVDIGTTTVMANLIDLNKNTVLETAAVYNSQMQYGEDVINRILYTQESKKGLHELNRLTVGDINSLVHILAEKTGIDRTDIDYIMCTGNTIMIHLFLTIPPDNIRREPYIPVVGNPPTIHAEEIGIGINRRGLLGFLPNFGAYVGSDITAGIIASGMAFEEKVCLLIDVGTNGEVVLGCKDWFICCSASAGPALEGAGTSCGMMATAGAIERVRISGMSDLDVTVVGGDKCKPAGICGTGYIDLIAELFAAGFLDRTGRFRMDKPCSRLRHNETGPEFVVATAEQSATASDIIITEGDILTLIRTKGSIFTAAEAIINHVGLSWSSIDRVFISGGFGNFLDVERSVAIGLLPNLDLEKFHFIGNGSIAGARMCLVSKEALILARDIAAKMTYFDLSNDTWFMKEYSSSLFLPHTDIDKFATVQRM